MRCILLDDQSITQALSVRIFALVLLLTASAAVPGMDQASRLDFDGDGISDIAVYREGPSTPTATYSGSWWYYLSSANGSLGSIPWGTTTDVPIPGDFNGDFKTDPTIFRSFEPFTPPFDLNYIWISPSYWTIPADASRCTNVPVADEPQPCPLRAFGNVSGRKMARNFVREGTPTPTASVSPTPQKAELGEFQRTNVSTNVAQPSYAYTFYYQNGYDGNLKARQTNMPAGAGGTYNQVPVPDDYDGDGESEVAVYDSTAGCYYYWEEESSTEPEEIPCFGPGGTPVPGDYNGDGKTDFAVTKIDGTSMIWHVRMSSNPTTVVLVPFGNKGDRAVPAYYDGDKFTDLAVVRPGGSNNANLRWLIRKSMVCPFGTNCTPTVDTLFGFATDQVLAVPYFNIPGY